MRKLRWIATVMAFALIAAACSGGDDGSGGAGGDVTLDFWALQEDLGPYLESIEAAFEDENPNIDLKVTSFPEENFGVKIDTALAAGRVPDLAQIWGPDYMSRGILLPLDDIVAEEGLDLSTFSQAIVREGDEFSCAYDGKLYCLGSFQGASMLLYNKDLFDAAGVPYPETYPAMTPDEFLEIACQLTDTENQIWGAAVADPLSFMPWEVFVSPDGRTAEGYVNGDESIELHEDLAQAFADGCLPSLNVLDPWAQGLDYLASGQLGMVVTDFLNLNKLEKAGIKYGAAVPPTPAGMEPYFFVWTDSVGVFADSDSPDEAKQFLAFLATEGQRIRYEETGDIPLDSKIAKEVDWAAGVQGRREGLEVLEYARPAVFVPNRWDVFAPIYDAWDLILAGEKTAEEALNDVAPDIQENLEKEWEVWEEQTG
jgi:multiple sugar transport system substrate-binding protein